MDENDFDMPDALRDYLIVKGDIKDYESDYDDRVRPVRGVHEKINWSLHFDDMKKIIDRCAGGYGDENDTWSELLIELDDLLDKRAESQWESNYE